MTTWQGVLILAIGLSGIWLPLLIVLVYVFFKGISECIKEWRQE